MGSLLPPVRTHRDHERFDVRDRASAFWTAAVLCRIELRVDSVRKRQKTGAVQDLAEVSQVMGSPK